MTLAAEPLSFLCPGCQATLAAEGPTQCPHCRWKGEAYLFTPRAMTVDHAEAALPDDAACLHHPTKRATAVCAGTGDYICPLCAVEIKGQTYSAAYLDAGGKEKAAEAFDRKLPRPDTLIYTYLILVFIPVINYAAIPLAFVWLPHAFVLYFRARRMRRENPLFARVMRRSSLVTIPILLTLFSALWIAGVVAIVFAIKGARF